MHDAKGRELSVGDRVMIPCWILVIHAGWDYCNVDVESIATMPGNGSSMRTSAINTQQLLRANIGDDVTFKVVVSGTDVRLR